MARQHATSCRLLCGDFRVLEHDKLFARMMDFQTQQGEVP
jgi:hypothetical protein